MGKYAKLLLQILRDTSDVSIFFDENKAKEISANYAFIFSSPI